MFQVTQDGRLVNSPLVNTSPLHCLLNQCRSNFISEEERTYIKHCMRAELESLKETVAFFEKEMGFKPRESKP